VRFSDPGFQCQQGGYGGDNRGTLCTAATTGGGHQNNGEHLSWGIDTDGASSANTAVSEIQVRYSSGVTILDTLEGVLASISLDGAGNLDTLSGETRRATGSSGGGCLTNIRWSGTAISCGSLQVTDLIISGVATEVAADTTPDAFSFADQTDVPVSTVVSAGPETITGLTAPAPVMVTGTGAAGLRSGAPARMRPAIGDISDGEQICVRHTSAGPERRRSARR
jgi:hypothetical protein